jgi:mannosyl-3-phosphoglycerate phosphatase family protein
MMTNRKTRWIVITDLDGTMLDHDSYSPGNVSQAIDKLDEDNIPVIFNTSKTYTETRALQDQLDVHDPFIVENGSCIYLPKKDFLEKPGNATSRDNYWAITIGKSHQEISRIIESINVPGFCCVRLSKCTTEQAMEITGLSKEQAEQAITREFSEPLIWNAGDASLKDFKKQLKPFALTTQQGGRFLHVLGECDKGKATKILTECYGHDVKTIILGDSPNDADMLAVADISIIVNSPSSHQLQQIITPTIQTKEPAPSGWNEGINKALLQIQDA